MSATSKGEATLNSMGWRLLLLALAISAIAHLFLASGLQLVSVVYRPHWGTPVSPIRTEGPGILDRIEDEDGICDVHGIEMTEKIVPIIYGFPAEVLPPRGLAATRFPHGKTFLLGGCCVDANSPRKARVHFCEDCHEALLDWTQSIRLTTDPTSTAVPLPHLSMEHSFRTTERPLPDIELELPGSSGIQLERWEPSFPAVFRESTTSNADLTPGAAETESRANP
ncbi:MAG: hypothetical protein AAGF67_10085 [Verrucomicrobiota bacterium]